MLLLIVVIITCLIITANQNREQFLAQMERENQKFSLNGNNLRWQYAMGGRHVHSGLMLEVGPIGTISIAMDMQVLIQFRQAGVHNLL